MMNTLRVVSSIICFFAIINIQNTKAQDLDLKPVKLWELDGFSNPESVIVDEQSKNIYISNVNGNPTDKDTNGYISKLSLDGNVIKKKWITGLNAPKGLGIYGRKLFIADIDRIVEVDIPTSKIVNIHDVKGATFLNDITVGKDGAVYVSNTFGFSAIFRLKNDKVEMLTNSNELSMPNGLLLDNENLVISSWGYNLNPNNYTTELAGCLLNMDTATKIISKISTPIGNLDGLVKISGGYLISDWIKGQILHLSMSSNKVKEIIRLEKGTADIYFFNDTQTLYVPLMNDNKLVAYKIESYE